MKEPTKELVIKISDGMYQAIVDGSLCCLNTLWYNALKDGKLLPPGHGKIGDLDKFEADFKEKCYGECACCSYSYGYDECGLFKEAEVLIEADKEDCDDNH